MVALCYHHRVASEGHCVTTAPWLHRMARLQSSTGEVFESHRTWCIQRPGCCFQLRLGGRPTDRSMCLQSAMWALSNSAICPKIEIWWAAGMSLNSVRHVRASTLMLLTKLNQWIPSICRLHFMWKAYNAFMSAARKVQVSAANTNTESTRAWYTCTCSLVVSVRRRSFQTRLSEAMTEEASLIQRLISWVQYPLEDCRLPR